ncbi:peptidoglycan-recognition protein LC isoform X1 [Solenopsis invicta]|uniref:peptidoglycan-recognition protein LC isoform X1 n=1 Tax=Solenopsis invicta TaxID=13686 RepID=UPI000595BF0D|nr:peptidoglycan-recognition protein LC isoform X1 [Solenopsis invicta]XP_025991686.1 peptidoglycan-recognition protein LC isoform X1 [Solenopsis invicta]XP_039309474.1 peptidoglycan-recognition protein LC isoform X1 [Solenopsis invicta]
MGMVTLVQQQQQTLNSNHQCPKEPDRNSNNGVVVTTENHAVEEFHGEAACSAKETRVVVPSNGSIGNSSTQCSDIDDDDEEEETDVEEGGGGGWITNLPESSTIVQQHQAIATTNGGIVLPNADPSNFGDICVKNSTNVHLGNKTFYKGPVTIKQFVCTNPALVQDVDKLDASKTSDINVLDLSTSKDDGASNRPIFSQNTDLDKVTQWLWTWRCAALSCVLVLILLAAVVITSIYFTHHSNTPLFPEIPDSSIEGVITSSVRFVERNEWGAEPPAQPLTKLKLPVPYVIISHTAQEPCVKHSECTYRVRIAQTYHIESKNWSDIGYNFLVGGDGRAYVGRSWDHVGAHSYNFNSRSIGISFIGTFNKVVPPKTQLHAAQKIIEIGVKNEKISPDYKLLGHRQVSPGTLSPGDALYNEIKKWPHWSPYP